MNFLLDDYLINHYDLPTIYNFYNDLNNKIKTLIEYSIKHDISQKIVDDLIEISDLYYSLVMQQLDNI